MTALRRNPKRILALGLVILLLVVGGVAFSSKLVAAYYVNRGGLALNQALLTDMDEVSRGEALLGASALYQEALRWDPANHWAHHNLGAIYLVQGQNTAAIEALQPASDHPATAFALGEASFALGDEASAITSWQKADAAPYLLARGKQLASAGEREAAERMYRLALAVDPSFSPAYYALGDLYGQAGHVEEAMALYQTAIPLELPFSAHRYAALGQVHAWGQEWEQAEVAYRQAVALNPADPELHWRLGVALSQQHRYEEARAAFQEALSIDDGYLRAYQGLTSVSIAAGECEDAARWAEQLPIDVSAPLRADVARQVALCFSGQHLPEQAIPHLQRAASLRPESVADLLALGDAYASARRFAEAIRAYRRALLLDPGNRHALRQLEGLEGSVP